MADRSSARLMTAADVDEARGETARDARSTPGVSFRLDGAALPATAAGASQVERLGAALADEMQNLYRIVWYVGDPDGPSDDDVLELLGVLAANAVDEVAPGFERAWLLRTLLHLLDAHAGGPAADLPNLDARAAGATRDTDVEGVATALQDLEKLERATVVLVVQEGLSLEEGARIQGGSRNDFARRYVEAMATLRDEHVSALC